jgi:hypothetical protein
MKSALKIIKNVFADAEKNNESDKLSKSVVVPDLELVRTIIMIYLKFMLSFLKSAIMFINIKL